MQTRRAHIIARVLLKCGFVRDEREGLAACHKVFEEYFRDEKFDDWNQPVSEEFARSEVDAVPPRSSVRVDDFIRRLSRF